ncbi:MAG: Rpn family recombination-promoting nuclease/putative transposase [Alphaproteobacteria bacterium]|nr:Rpn family recombination-promoting nuclease/putative transposase [Alphaproteobacteria bacterium]
MTHRVDPRVDYVFKRLLGAPENLDLLLDFLNSLLDLPSRVSSVELLNPFNERDYDDDKLSVVDVKAVDARGRRFQVEIQLQAHPALDARILYTWARVYIEQLSAGAKYSQLRPTYSIWLLDDVLLPDAPAHHHTFLLHDPDRSVTLGDQLAIHLVELPKWAGAAEAMTPEDRWIYFFKNAGAWDDLPTTLGTPTMRKAMDVLKNISQRERDMARYESRMDQLRVRRIYEEQAEQLAALQVEVKERSAELQETSTALQETSTALQETSTALQEKSAELQEKDAALQQREEELARLRQRLTAAGLDPEG